MRKQSLRLMVPNMPVLRLAAVAIIVVGGCTEQGTTRAERPPAEVGGKFSLGGFSFGDSDQPYGYKGDLSQSEEELRAQARKFDMTVWQGVLIGAVAGTVVGVVAGGDAEDAAGGAIVGAGIGALAGMYVANKQKAYASAEDRIESMIADVQASNREAEELILSARQVLAEDQRRLAAVQARLAQGQATERQFQQERARVWGNRKVVEQAAVGARDQYLVYDAATSKFARQNPTTSTKGFNDALADYRSNIETLDAIVDAMGKA